MLLTLYDANEHETKNWNLSVSNIILFQVHSSLDFKKTFSDERRLKIGATDTPWLQYNLIL